MIGPVAMLLLALQPASAEPPACTAARARPATVAAIASAPAQFVGRCVTVTGRVSGHSLQSPSGASPQEIGLYGGAVRYAGPSAGEVVVTGTVDTCLHMRLRAQARRSPGQPLVLLRGYCHRSSGPVIRIESFRVDQGGQARRRHFADNLTPSADEALILRRFPDSVTIDGGRS